MRTIRDLYVLIYRDDMKLLETLERDPKALAGQFTARHGKVMSKLNFQNNNKPSVTLADIAGLLVIACFSQPTLDAKQFQMMINIFYHQPVQVSFSWHAVSASHGKLVEKEDG